MAKHTRSNPEEILKDMCHRIERVCRHGALTVNEVTSDAMVDRDMVSSIYQFYKNQGFGFTEAGINARVDMIRFILFEALS